MSGGWGALVEGMTTLVALLAGVMALVGGVIGLVWAARKDQREALVELREQLAAERADKNALAHDKDALSRMVRGEDAINAHNKQARQHWRVEMEVLRESKDLLHRIAERMPERRDR